MKLTIVLLLVCMTTLSFASTNKKFSCESLELQTGNISLGAKYHVEVTDHTAKLYVTYVVPNAHPQLVINMHNLNDGSISEIFWAIRNEEKYEFVNLGNINILSFQSRGFLSSYNCELK